MYMTPCRQQLAHISFDSRLHASWFSQASIALRIQYVLCIYLLCCASAFISLLMPLLTQGSVCGIQLDPSLQEQSFAQQLYRLQDMA